MPVVRVEKNKDYTVMSNYHLRDKALSLKAKGLLSQILSLPEDWDYTLSGLCHINRESKDAIRSAVNELERAGYIERHQTTDASGKFSGNEYIIHESPIPFPPFHPLPLGLLRLRRRKGKERKRPRRAPLRFIGRSSRRISSTTTSCTTPRSTRRNWTAFWNCWLKPSARPERLSGWPVTTTPPSWSRPSC